MVERRGRNISVERALRWLRSFVEREWALLLPVVLAFFGLPRLVVLLLTPRMDPVPRTLEQLQAFSASLPGWWTPLLIAMLLASAIGAMVLMAMALVPRISVGEAILLALRRLPAWIGIGLIVGAALFLALLVAMTVAVRLGGGGQMLSVTLAFLGILVCSLLLLLLLPLIAVRRLGPLAAIREGWRLFRGALLRILGGLLLFAAGAWVISLALQVSLGSVLLLAARAAGQPQLGQLLAAVVMSVVSAIGWGGFYLLIAAFYRQRAGIE